MDKTKNNLILRLKFTQFFDGPGPSGLVARRSLTSLEDPSSIPDAGNDNVVVI